MNRSQLLSNIQCKIDDPKLRNSFLYIRDDYISLKQCIQHYGGNYEYQDIVDFLVKQKHIKTYHFKDLVDVLEDVLEGYRW
jgi:hypothetical protein